MSDTIPTEELLQVRYIVSKLVISLSKRALKHVAENIPGHEITVVDVDKFAESVLSALHEEQEDGSTLVHRMLDEAIVFAVEQGMDGFAYEDEPEPEKTCCPECKSNKVECTTMGGLSHIPPGNTGTCLDCGWKGSCLDMVPEPFCPRKSQRGGCGCPEIDGLTPKCADGHW